MYIPSQFAVPDPAVLHRILREHPLGMLVTSGPQGLDADHLPFEFTPAPGPSAPAAPLPAGPGSAGDGQLPAAALGTLTAHVARANPLWQRAQGQPVMVVFRGAEAFVSPSWYPSKHEFHRQVPTWNYEVVHVHGVLVVRDDERFVRGLVARLTREHESREARPWKMTDSAPDFIDSLLRNIVGIEIPIRSMVGKSKLSQNREPRDRLGAAAVLDGRGHGELAQRMRDAG